MIICPALGLDFLISPIIKLFLFITDSIAVFLKSLFSILSETNFFKVFKEHLFFKISISLLLSKHIFLKYQSSVIFLINSLVIPSFIALLAIKAPSLILDYFPAR